MFQVSSAAFGLSDHVWDDDQASGLTDMFKGIKPFESTSQAESQEI